jgi:chorismate-pyruvate lyase
MRRPPTWPELDRLTRFVRAADSLTDVLGTWTGRGVEVRMERRVDGVAPEPSVAGILDLHDGARVQEREVSMWCADLVVAEARSWVAADSPALTPAVRQSLRSGGSLGELLRPLRRRRTTVWIAARATAPLRDAAAPVLAVQARLDVAGTPVAWCEETIYEAVFAWDDRLLSGAPRRDLTRRVGLVRTPVPA